jgi:hypothetical protein
MATQPFGGYRQPDQYRLAGTEWPKPPDTTPMPLDTTASPTGASTYLALTLTSASGAILAAPQFLAVVGLISDASLQAWATFLGMVMALPMVILVPVAACLSLVGLVRGPLVLRIRLVTWWLVGAGGGTLASAWQETPGFNPYLATQSSTFGIGDALGALCLVVCMYLAVRWWRQALSQRRNQRF